MLFSVTYQGGNIVAGREESAGEDFGAGEGEVGYAVSALADLVEVGG